MEEKRGAVLIKSTLTPNHQFSNLGYLGNSRKPKLLLQREGTTLTMSSRRGHLSRVLKYEKFKDTKKGREVEPANKINGICIDTVFSKFQVPRSK